MKKYLLILVILVVGVISIIYIYRPNIFLFWKTATVQEVTRYANKTGDYNCSQPIKVISLPNLDYNPNRRPFPSSKYYSDPVNPDEAKLFCRPFLFLESEGILKILQRPEVLQLISKYQYQDVSVKALKFELIKDHDFVNRLLPTYKNREIGCIIVVETPGEKKVYLEDEKLQAFEELSYDTFNKYLNAVSSDDRQLFIENLH